MPIRKILLLILLTNLASAGQIHMFLFGSERREWLDRVFQEQLMQSLGTSGKEQKELDEKRDAQLRERQFLRLAQRFLERWRDARKAHEYNTRGAVNPKKLKAASRAFRELEKSEGWLGGR